MYLAFLQQTAGRHYESLVPTIRSPQHLIGFGSYESQTYQIDGGRKGNLGADGSSVHGRATVGYSGALDFAVRFGLGGY